MSNSNTPDQKYPNRCPYCGATGVNGYEGCQALMHEVSAQVMGGLANFAAHRTAVDCYALQHPEFYCVSAKSYAAHLAGLCCKMEFEDRNEAYAAVQRWLNGNVDLQKPNVLSFRGDLTITHLHGAPDSVEHIKRLDEWSRSVWDAYAEQHNTARSFVRSALAAKR